MKVLAIFGSASDKNVYEDIERRLREKNIPVEVRALSAHRTPAEVDALPFDSYSIIIAGAGLAAHLPGVIAARTTTPVIGVPCTGVYEGLDAWLAIVQMPPGTPVLSVGVGRASEAARAAELAQKTGREIHLCFKSKNQAVEKAMQVLDEFDAPFTQGIEPKSGAINVVFVQRGEHILQEGITITCPCQESSVKDDAIHWLDAASHGLWVGLNRGENAALGALQLTGKYREQIRAHKENIRRRALAQDEVSRHG